MRAYYVLETILNPEDTAIDKRQNFLPCATYIVEEGTYNRKEDREVDSTSHGDINCEDV